MAEVPAGEGENGEMTAMGRLLESPCSTPPLPAKREAHDLEGSGERVEGSGVGSGVG